MPITHSPLRYPGGKTAIFDIISTIADENNIKPCNYAEPYAGGAGLALTMLFSGYASNIYLNDIDRSIWAFWYSILNNCDDFIKKIESTDITIEEWHKQRDIQNNKTKASLFDLGFSSFFLNRTNRSGIILKAGVIGGLSQNGKYTLDCRFNKTDLIRKIKKIKSFEEKIHISNEDAIDFMNNFERKNVTNPLLCIDPPYFEKGSSLYTNFYEKDDHSKLRDTITSLKSPWILTYDNADEIRELYKNNDCFNFDINYSAANKRVGKEILVKSKNINLPTSLNIERLIAA
ncbi:DNA adenine methylase [Pantoea vagans]|uniref:site-specific DNA-methyltransferase (adenine-specific) n=1 Tax=Pantoea vagans TaxID=470934 RepID=A0AAN1NS23_9GAMM|nr:DNA adenine methylase [Pantoea vagans]AVV38162.1 DNA methyltransferase [Pantoea vagans]